MAKLLIDADGHITEPRDLWTDRIDKDFRDRAPRVGSVPGQEGEFWLCDGLRPHPTVAGAFLGAVNDPSAYEEFLKKTSIEDSRPGGWVPAERLKDMEQDGVESCLMYPTSVGMLYRLSDAPFLAALCRTYNDWMAEFCSYDSKTLAGVGVVSLLDIDDAANEVRRCAKMGMKSVLLPLSTPGWTGFDNPELDKVWSAAVDSNIPVSFHTFNGAWWWPLPNEPRDMRIITVNMDYPARRALTQMLFSRVFDRFPQLKLVIAEMTIGWMPYFFLSADERYRTRPYHSSPLPDVTPSEYFRRQMWATTIADRDDPFMAQVVDLFGDDRWMCSTDYPHVESSWPHSHEANARLMAALDDTAKEKITRTNAASLYGLKAS